MKRYPSEWISSTSFIPNGAIIAAIPTIKRMLNKFEPIILPKTTSPCLRQTAEKVVANSGRDVPTATTDNPIISSDTLKIFANPTAPSIK